VRTFAVRFVITAVAVAAIAVAGGNAVTLPGYSGKCCARLALQRTGMYEQEQTDDEQNPKPATHLSKFVPVDDHLSIIGSIGLRVKGYGAPDYRESQTLSLPRQPSGGLYIPRESELRGARPSAHRAQRATSARSNLRDR